MAVQGITEPMRKISLENTDGDSGMGDESKPITGNRSNRSLSITSTKSNQILGTNNKNQKLPMNKIKVGLAPPPNLSIARAKIGSLENSNHQPGGGNVQIPQRKISIEGKPRIAARNENYIRSGGDKKIHTLKLQWDAKPKIGSLENANRKPSGGAVKIENRKLDFKEKAKAKVGSTVNIKHTPGGGNVKIFDEKDYYRQRKDSGFGQASSSKASFDGAASRTESPEC